MAKCKECGHEINDQAQFCEYCGAEVKAVEYTKKSVKCDSCGRIINSFEAFCPCCGKELRNTKASDAYVLFHHKYHREKDIDVKINLITTFSVPNNKEDLLEFIFMAISNINPDVYLNEEERKDGVRLNEAWKSSYERVIKKAETTLNKENDVKLISKAKEEYDTKIKLIDSIKRKMKFQHLIYKYWWVALVTFGLVGGGICVNNYSSKKEAASNLASEKAQQMIDESKKLIIEGKLDEAKNIALEITTDPRLSKKSKESFSKQQEDLFELINQELLEIHDEKMNKIVDEVNSFIDNQEYEKARIEISKLHESGLFDNESKWNNTKNELTKALDEIESSIHTSDVDKIIDQVNTLIDKKEYSKAYSLTSKIRGNDKSTEEESKRLDEVRESLIEVINSKLALEHNEKMSSIVTEVRNLTSRKLYDKARTKAYGVKGESYLNAVEYEKWERTRNDLLAEITSAEHNNYSALINGKIEKVRNEISRKNYQSARTLISQIKGNNDSTSVEVEEYNKIRTDLTDELEKAIVNDYRDEVYSLIGELKSEIRKGNIDNIEYRIEKVRGNSKSSQSDNVAWDKARAELNQLVKEAKEKKNHQDYVTKMNQYDSIGRSHLKSGNFSEARDYANLIVANSDSTYDERTRFNQMRNNLLADIEKAEKAKKDVVTLTNSASYFNNKTVDSAESYFRQLGFKNIIINYTEQEDRDYKRKVATVNRITIGNTSNFVSGQAFSKNEQIVVQATKYVRPKGIILDKSLTYYKNKDYKTVVNEFKAAGFNNVTAKAYNVNELPYSVSVNGVKDITVNGNIMSSNTYYNSNLPVIITYYNQTGVRPYLYLVNYRDNNGYIYLEQDLKNKGFKYIDTQAVEVDKLPSGFSSNGVISLYINGVEYDPNKYYSNSDSVLIKYYKEVKPKGIKYTYASNEFYGKFLSTATTCIRGLGFTNVRTEVSYADSLIGPGHGQIVYNIKVNGQNIKSNTVYPKDAEIVIEYKEIKEIKISSSILNSSKNYKEMERELRSLGFKNISYTPYPVDNLGGHRDNDVYKVLIDGMEATTYNSYQANKAVVIQYYEYHKPTYFISDEGMSYFKNKPYLDIQSEFSRLGFVNISCDFKEMTSFPYDYSDGGVFKVTIGGRQIAAGQRYEYSDKVVISYYKKVEPKGINISSSDIDYLIGNSCKNSIEYLKILGFKNVVTSMVKVTSLPDGASKEGVKDIEINGISINSNYTYNMNDTVNVYYYYESGIRSEVRLYEYTGVDSAKQKGSTDLSIAFRREGFKNVTKKELTVVEYPIGYSLFGVKEVLVDGKKFDNSVAYDPNARIEIIYYNANGITGPAALDSNYETCRNNFRYCGFKNIELKPIEVNELPHFKADGEVKEVLVNGSSYTVAKMYDPQSKIEIKYYKLIVPTGIRLDYDSSYYVGQKGDMVLSELRRFGFTNIDYRRYEVESLDPGIYNDDVKEVTIDGSSIDTSKYYDKNAKVVIISYKLIEKQTEFLPDIAKGTSYEECVRLLDERGFHIISSKIFANYDSEDLYNTFMVLVVNGNRADLNKVYPVDTTIVIGLHGHYSEDAACPYAASYFINKPYSDKFYELLSSDCGLKNISTQYVDVNQADVDSSIKTDYVKDVTVNGESLVDGRYNHDDEVIFYLYRVN